MKTIMMIVKGFAGLAGLLLLVGCLDSGSGSQDSVLLDSWSVPCDSGVIDTNVDGSPDYAILGLNGSISILFKESVDPNSFNVNTGISSSPSVSFNASFAQTASANDTLILSPAGSYSAGQVYQVTLLANAVRPADSNSARSQSNDSSIKFLAADTAADTVHPYISRMTPPNNATNVSPSQILTFKFSKHMASVRMYRQNGYPNLPADIQGGWSNSTTFTLTTATGLQPNTTYSIVFDPSDAGCALGTYDDAGNRIVTMAGSANPSSVVWTFTTGAQ